MWIALAAITLAAAIGFNVLALAIQYELVGDRLVWGDPQLEGRAPSCRQRDSQLANLPPWFERPTGSITGFVGVSTQPIFPQLTSGLEAFGCSLGTASRSSTTLSRPPYPRISLRFSSNSKRRNRIDRRDLRSDRCEAYIVELENRLACHVHTRAALARL
jgi:hypothetical protein